MNRLILPYKLKIMLESVVKSIIVGFFIASCVCFIPVFILHLIAYEISIPRSFELWGILGTVMSVLLFFVWFWPRKRLVAKRMDEAGLDERVRTMLDLKKDKSLIAELQRDDTKQLLKVSSPSQMKLKFRKKHLIICFCVIAMTVGLMFVPYDIMLAFSEPAAVEQEDPVIVEMIQKLRDIIAQAPVDEETRQDLTDIVDELEQQIKQVDSIIEKIAMISTAERRIQELLERALTYETIGNLLMQHSSTYELGKAINTLDSRNTDRALDNMADRLHAIKGEEQADMLEDISSSIDSALDESGVGYTDLLYMSLKSFANRLDTSVEKVRNGEDDTEGIDKAIDLAKRMLQIALEQQKQMQEMLQQLEQAMEDAKQELLGEEEPPQDDEQQPPEEQPPEQSDSEGEGEEGTYQPGEAVYEPSLDEFDTGYVPGKRNEDGSIQTQEPDEENKATVAYDQIFTLYYSDILEDLAEEKIPKDISRIIEQYYASLYK